MTPRSFPPKSWWIHLRGFKFLPMTFKSLSALSVTVLNSGVALLLKVWTNQPPARSTGLMSYLEIVLYSNKSSAHVLQLTVKHDIHISWMGPQSWLNVPHTGQMKPTLWASKLVHQTFPGTSWSHSSLYGATVHVVLGDRRSKCSMIVKMTYAFDMQNYEGVCIVYMLKKPEAVANDWTGFSSNQCTRRYMQA